MTYRTYWTRGSLILLLVCGLWAESPSYAQRARPTERDVTYCTIDGVDLKLDLYYPEAARGALPVAMYVHGGGWRSGDKSGGAGFQDVPELLRRGYLVASINYRLAPQYRFPAQIQDVKCAVRSLRAHAAAWGLDPERIGAWGSSAGGHLVSLLGTADASAGWDVGPFLDQSSRVSAVANLFGPTDLTQTFEGANPRLLGTVFGASLPTDRIVAEASPVSWVSADDPPFLFLHGERDTLVPPEQSEILHEALLAAGVPAELVIVANAGHGFKPEGGPVRPSRAELTRTLADFFDAHVR